MTGIPTDRDLGGSTSQDRLTSVPVNLESLPKECKPIISAPATANTNTNSNNVHNPNTLPSTTEAAAADLEGDDHPGAIITSSRRVRRDTFSGHPHNIILCLQGMQQSQGSQGSGAGIGGSLEASIQSSRNNTARTNSGASSPRQANSASKFRRTNTDKNTKGKKQ